MLVLMAIEDMMGDLGCTSITAAATIEKALALSKRTVRLATSTSISAGSEAIPSPTP